MDLAKTYAAGNTNNSDYGDLSDMVVHGYSSMGTVVASFGTAQVEAREAVMPGRQVVVRSVRVELTTGGDYPQTAIASVAYDNVDTYISVLEKMQFTKINRDRFDFSEVQFEMDGLKVIVFNNDRGDLMWALSADTVSIHFNSIQKMHELKSLFERAKTHLDDTKL